jgi:hypothetical protein
MKYFICALYDKGSSSENCLLGIPAEHTERIIPVDRAEASIFKTENNEVFISIPALFKLKDPFTPHGLILKSTRQNVKTTLLLPKIDLELEIPEEEIHLLPRTLNETLKYFRGVYFTSNMILILNPIILMDHMK